jgi:hypothetical protein
VFEIQSSKKRRREEEKKRRREEGVKCAIGNAWYTSTAMQCDEMLYAI